MISHKKFLLVIAIILGIFISGYSNKVAFACWDRSDCDGATCAGANPPYTQGTCTGGGTECGFGIGSACPGDLTCDNGNCVCASSSCATPTNPWTCFAAGTKVSMADPTSPTASLGAQRSKNIEDVVVGDKVVSQDEAGNKSVSTVTALDQPIREHMCRVDFVDSKELKMTNEHPIMTAEGWKSITPSATAAENPDLIVSSLGIGDKVVREDGGRGEVKDITCWSKRTPAYNLILDGNVNTYFADGYLAHNKGGIIKCEKDCPAGQSANWNSTTRTCTFGAVGLIVGDAVKDGGKVAACSYTDSSDKYHATGDSCLYAACKPTCTDRDPTAPSLISPANGYVAPYGTTSVNLSWNPPNDWGKDCDGNNQHYVLRGSTTDANKANSVVWENLTKVDTDTNKTVQAGTTYWWFVRARNGSLYKDSSVRSFSVAPCTNIAPTAPSLVAPANGSTQPGLTVGLYWSPVSSWGRNCAGNSNTYFVRTATTQAALASATYQSVGAATSKSFTATSYGTYYWQVRSHNGALYADSAIRSFTLANDSISGRVYLDENNLCATVPWTAGGSVKLDSTDVALNGSGQFSTTTTPGTHSLSVNMPANYKCSSGPCGVCSGRSVSTGSIENFFINSNYGNWWQAEGAGIYSGGDLRSSLPSNASRLITTPVGGTVGALIVGNGSVDLGSGSVSDANWNTKSKYRGKQMDFEYFASRMGLVRSESGEWPLVSEIDLAQYPTGKDFGYKNGDGTVSQSMTVGAGEKFIVFVNGDLNISANITVASGGYLAFIVNGDITVAPNVTLVQGIYIATSDFVTESNSPVADSQLNVAGTVVAWGTFSLSRDLGGVVNASTPAEKFTYRPDLLTNMPEAMKMFAMVWSEVVPGTFDN